ncbi:hypothetical protein ElyMa_003037300 [Elysia marginata]|uniref:Reverse transcriptase zinc-binding domain-containing protein n=1 Tax=Elysia marginata TaxID=1093978 RepID=A0AAV4IKW9_9GAST|nr:hypothetical protein ElyMa_003037300 [Elysia marginata]
MENHLPGRSKEAGLSRKERVLSQLRTGGNSPISNNYLHRIGVIDDPNCKDCPGRLDDMKHILLHCSRLKEDRKKTTGAKAHPKTSTDKSSEMCRLPEGNCEITPVK